MSAFFLGILFAVVMPLAEGVLFALLLREIHIRHPLPLGGLIGTARRQRPARPDKPAEIHETSEKLDIDEVMDNQDTQKAPDVADTVPPESATSSEFLSLPSSSPANEEKTPESSEIDVFSEAKSIPDNLPVSEVLSLMTSETSAVIPNDLEHRIEETARSDEEVPLEIRDSPNDTNAEDMYALAAALPREKIDFGQELEGDSQVSSSISPMAKEMFGENFDFEALEKQSKSFRSPVPDQDAHWDYPADVPMDVQEPESGVVQVSSPFIFNAAPLLADFVDPQTIIATFSNGYIQETGDMVETIEGDTSKFCFTEESRPMFVRKKKSS